MATSPIYGWAEPDNTDLVKNGALAIRTLGNAIDTTMGTMTPKSIVDAKGDIVAASANDTPARLAVGNNGEVLVADSATSTGLRYQGSQAAGKNAVINGGFDVWQRGTSFTLNGVYTADRWYIDRTGTLTITQDTAIAPADFTYAAKLTAGSTGDVYYVQAIETLNAEQYAGKTVTLSAFVGTSNSQNVTLRVDYTTATDTAVNSGSWTAITPTSGGTSATTSTLAKASAVFAIPSTTKSLRVLVIALGLTNTNWLGVTGVQLELGSVATSFTRTGGTIQGELAACQRYYYRINANGASTFPTFGMGFANTTSNVNVQCQFPVTMRTKPSAIDTSSVSNFQLDYANTGVSSLTSITIDTNYSSSDSGAIAVVKSAAYVLGTIYRMSVSSSVAAYIGWSAEL
jgi:hypothetical protein